MAWDNPSAKSLDEILCEPGTTLCVQSISRHRTPLTSVLTSILAGRSSCKYDTLVVLENQELVIEQMLPRVAESGAVATIVTQRTPLNYIPRSPSNAGTQRGRLCPPVPADLSNKPTQARPRIAPRPGPFACQRGLGIASRVTGTVGCVTHHRLI